MPLVVDVPLNTAIADLDEVLRLLLRRELERHGFEGVDIAFDAPSKDWSGRLTSPTVDLFLYDLREALDRAEGSSTEVRANGVAREHRPPLRLELTYAVTAWTKAVEDEHRLLSQVLAILFAHGQLPSHLTEGRLDASARRRAIETEVGRPREQKSDFWTSVGGAYKASIDYVVRLELESGATFVRGPEVRVQTIRAGLADGPRGAMAELHRLGGTVTRPEGEPVEDAWVALPDDGRWTSTDRQGRFRVDRLVEGSHRVVARTADGAEAEATVSVPGARADLVLRPRRG
jgi:hypothetical protein